MPGVPHFIGFEAPVEERDGLRDLATNLNSLFGYVNDLRAAVDLFQTSMDEFMAMHRAGKSAESERFSGWKGIAARDGAMTLYHFGKVWTDIPGQIARSPTLAKLVDREALKAGGNAFENGFPQWAGIRKGVAHRGDFGKSAARRKEHSVTSALKLPGVDIVPTGGTYFTNSIVDSTYFCTVEGKVVQYDVTPETANRLQSVFNAICAPIEDARRRGSSSFWRN